MARRSQRDDPKNLYEDLVRLLRHFDLKLAEHDLREQVRALIPVNYKLRDLGSSLIQGDNLSNAQNRIISYLKKYQGRLIEGDELMVVAGISEYARRIRELRVQDGWPILSGATIKELLAEESEFLLEGDSMLPADIKSDSYMLLENTQDRDAAHRWHNANRIRKKKIGTKAKILEYFLENIGKHVTGEELKYLANGRIEWQRRVRELRTEEGWPIMTRNSGSPGIPVGVYVLAENRQTKPHDRRIPDSVRSAVLQRDQWRCKICGWSYDDYNPADPRTVLELHHIIHHARGGENRATNLITLCNVDHDDVHRGLISEAQLKSLID